MSELLWNSAVLATPTKVISALEAVLLPKPDKKSLDDAEQTESVQHAQKSETMRRVLGLDGIGVLGKFQRARSLPVVNALLKPGSRDTPPGLGNWDNSCYQNSIIQGLASLPSFSIFLGQSNPDRSSSSTKAALKDIIEKLKHEENLGKIVWTPAQLKTMSSWQQQDAQEYFSKLMDEVEKETAKSSVWKGTDTGLAALRDCSSDSRQSRSTNVEETTKEPSPLPKIHSSISQLPDELQAVIVRNPFEGLLAQRVGCLKCGFVEGLSLIPFNCLTLPLGKHWLYDIRSCLDEYTALEPINGVDCAKCTLLQSKAQLEKLRSQFSDDTARELEASAPLVTEALKASVEERLDAVNEALENKDFSDHTILKKCQISQKSKVSSTKTRQAVIARAPKSLAIHVNRSVFDELTGMLSKNYADVRFPLRFNLASWCLGGRTRTSGEDNDIEHWNTAPSESMLAENVADADADACMYELRAALTHYGRHENGHYICYRRHGTNLESENTKGCETSWWRFSDEDVSAVSEDNALAQGGVFMLFYEKIDKPLPISQSDTPEVGTTIAEPASERVECLESDDAAALRELPDQSLPMQFKETDEDKASRSASILVDPAAGDANTDEAPVKPTTTPPASNSTSDLKKPSLVDSGSTISDRATLEDAGVDIPLPPNHPPPTLEPSSERQHETTTDTEPDLDTAPSCIPQNSYHPDHRPSFSHSMRTATPRSGRGKKGMGPVSSSSMVTAN